MAVLVTGGAGFIGRHLVHMLLGGGERVRIVDRVPLELTNVPAGAHIETVHADIRDAEAVADAMREIDEVYHVAAIPYLWAKPRGLFRRINYQGAVNVMNLALQAGVRRVVHVSSDVITGAAPALRPIGSYARAKHLAERHAFALARAGKPVIVACPTVPVGPGDWFRSPPTQMVLDFCRGGRHEYMDGGINLIDVRDVAAGLIAAMKIGRPGRRYVLGHENLTLRELFSRLARLTGLPPPTRRIPYGVALAAAYLSEWVADVATRRPPLATVLGVKLAQRPPNPHAADALAELGIQPRAIDDSLRETLHWLRAVGWLPALKTGPASPG